MPDFKKRPPADERSNSPAVQPQDELRRSYRDAKAKSGATPPPLPPFSKSKWSELLVAYFYSGWAFLIPYLATYLLYAWLKWPVNPSGSWMPCLLHVYWLLHATHLVLAGIALKLWWATGETKYTTAIVRFNEKPSTVKRIWPIVPWLLLALIFWIPKVYLEWPSDPWEHFARINQWAWHDTVRANPIWAKSSYFLLYSLIGNIKLPTPKFGYLTLLYTLSCQLLCWQYYLFGRSIGLTKKSSFLWVLLQVLLSGNNIFSFYRYYGISSSLFGQLSAIAVVRIAIDECRAHSPKLSSIRHRLFICIQIVLLLALAGFEHPQSLGVAVFGTMGLVGWRLRMWCDRISRITIVVSVLIILNIAAIMWLPQVPVLHDFYLQGWFSSWYGFNLTSFHSPAFAWAVTVLGISGFANFLAALILLRRNHLAAWITLTPFVALCLPIIVIPLANLLVTHNGVPANIATFPRMFFAIPPGIAIFLLFNKFRIPYLITNVPGFLRIPNSAFLATALTLLAFSVTPASEPWFNRFFNVFVRLPDDLIMKSGIETFTKLNLDKSIGKEVIVSNTGTAYVISAFGYKYAPTSSRMVLFPPTLRTIPAHKLINANAKAKMPITVIRPEPLSLITPGSLSAYLSHHWLPQECALEQIGAPELEHAAEDQGYVKTKRGDLTIYSNPLVVAH